jgi:SAM-dependent methyltransferase
MLKKINILIVFFVVAHCYCMDMKNQTLFLGLCSTFWDLEKPFPPSEEYALYRHYVANASGSILEPMCGTGRFLIPFVEEGFNVEGFDASPFMLNELRKKCKEKNISPRIWEQFLELMPETKKYELIFIPDTSFAIFTDLSHVKKCLQKIYALLQDKGVFVFSIQTIHARWGEIGVWTQKKYKKPDGDFIVENSLPLPIENSLSTLILRYELMHKDKIIKTETERYQIRLYHPGEMDALLKEVGFRKIKRMKEHNRTIAPSPEDEVIVYECIK